MRFERFVRHYARYFCASIELFHHLVVYGVRRRCMSRIQVLTPLLAFLACVLPAHAEDQAPGQDAERWMSFPRLQESWQRPGLGRWAGAAGADTYYAITDDGKAVMALDGATGRDRWRHELAEPVENETQGMLEDGMRGLLLDGVDRPLTLGDPDLLMAAQHPFETTVHLTDIDARTGRLRWARTIGSGHFRIVRSAADWLFRCSVNVLSGKAVLLVLSAKNGAERAKRTMREPFGMGPNGDVCTSGENRVSCSHLQRGRLVQRWSRSVAQARRSTVQLTSSSVVRIGDAIQVFRSTDGRLIFEHPNATFTPLDARHDRLFLFSVGQVEVVQLKDGSSSKFPWRLAGPPFPHLLHGERVSLIVPSRWKAGSLGLVDGRGQLRNIEGRGVEIDDLMENTALARTSDLTLDYQTKSILRAYSLVKLAPSAATLDEYVQTVAILEHYQMLFSAVDDALAAVRGLPHGMDRLEQAISHETGWTQLSAIRVAGASHSTRYLAVLRRLLGKVSLHPQTPVEERVLLEALGTVAAMESLQAAEDLFAFWQTSVGHIPDTHLRQHVQQEVLQAVWRYSADRDWQACPQRSFPVNPASPDAILGDEGPGEAALADDRRRWAVICQARHDDDGDGQLRVQTLEHGGTTGDALHPYLVLGSGPGTEVDDAYAAPQGDHLVVTLCACLYDVDTRTGKAVVLPHADGRARAGESYHYPAVAFSPDGTYLAYLRSRGQSTSLVLRDLQSGRERITDLGMEHVGGMRVDSIARSVLLEMTKAPAPDAPWIEWTVSGPREPLCHSHGTIDGNYRLKQPKPYFHWRLWPMAGGPPRDVASETSFPTRWQQGNFESLRDLLVPVKQAGRGMEGLPMGPFRWRPTE